MEHAHNFAQYLNDFLSSNKSLFLQSENAAARTVEQREKIIEQLSTFTTMLAGLHTSVAQALDDCKAAQLHDITTMDSLLEKLTKKDTKAPLKVESWTEVRRRKRAYVGAPTQQLAVICCDHNSKYTKIKITDALSISAVSVVNFDDVKQDGELYYVNSADHFAFKISGIMFHGNIGTIYTDEKTPEKIKNCKFGTVCMKRDKCDYYHDPIKFTGSRDHRNFIASSALYSPPDSQYKNRARSRRFGSREHLDIDIVGLQEDEITRLHDMAMHDLLCSVLLAQAKAV
jgi:hypothetical protein